MLVVTVPDAFKAASILVCLTTSPGITQDSALEAVLGETDPDFDEDRRLQWMTDAAELHNKKNSKILTTYRQLLRFRGRIVAKTGANSSLSDGTESLKRFPCYL